MLQLGNNIESDNIFDQISEYIIHLDNIIWTVDIFC